MNLATNLRQRFAGYFVILLMGTGTLAIATSAMAQPLDQNKLALQMAQSSSLTGNWRLDNMTESGAPTPLVPTQDTVLTADFSGDRVSGSGGCNRFMGGYQTDGDQLSIGPLASTFMACEDPILAQEIRYLRALEGAQRYELNSQGQLTIFYQTEQDSGVLRFTSQSVRGLW